MALIVQKYGGTSVGTIEKIAAVADKVASHVKNGDQIVVTVSAMSGETNRLIGLANEMSEKPHPREMDVIISTGEQSTIALLSMALIDRGCDARSYTGNQIRMLTDSSHGKARILDIQCDGMKEDLKQGRVVVVAGLLVCWYVGLLVCWFVGLLVCCWFVVALLLVCCWLVVGLLLVCCLFVVGLMLLLVC